MTFLEAIASLEVNQSLILFVKFDNSIFSLYLTQPQLKGQLQGNLQGQLQGKLQGQLQRQLQGQL